MATMLNEWKGNAEVKSVTVSSDSARIGVACGVDIVILDVDSGRKVLGPLLGRRKQLIKDTSAYISSVAFSPDGHALAFCSIRDLRLLDTETGKTRIQPVIDFGLFSTLAFTPDGRLLVSGGLSGEICLWDARTGQQAGRLNTGARISSLAVSSDGIKVASNGSGNSIHAYDIASRSMLFQCTGHAFPTISVAFSPDGRRLASGSLDSTVRLWDGSTGHGIGGPLEGHRAWPETVSFSPDGKYVASGSIDGTIRMWEADTCTIRYDPFSSHNGGLTSIAFTPNGSRLISGSRDTSVKIWNVQHPGPMALSKISQSISCSEHDIGGGPLSGDTGGVAAIAFGEPVELARPTELAGLEMCITATMSAVDIVSCLCAHGCIDMTGAIDLTKCSEYPIYTGGFGDIYRCRLSSATEAAIKTVRIYAGADEKDFKPLKRAAREIYMWSKCRHPNVQPLLGLVVFRGQLGMVATWEAKGNLLQYLKRYPEADRCTMNVQIADGLAYLHASGIVHGDLKGVNVLISQDQVAQLADFGCAMLHEYTLQFSQSSTKTNLTPRWASPELLQGGKHSQEADVYALGMTLLEAVTGEVPWGEKSDWGVISAVLIEKTTPERPVAYIPTVSEHGDSLWSLLKSCWMYEVDQRPSAEHVSNMLRGIKQEGLKAKN